MLEKRLEHTILDNTLIGVFIADIALIIHDSVIAYDTVDLVVETIGLLLVGSLYFLHRDDKHTRIISHILIISVFFLLDVTWYFNKGLGLGVALLFITALIIGQVLISEKYRMLLTVGSIVNMLTLVAVEGLSDDFFIYGLYNSGSNTPLATKTMFILISFILTSWVITRLKQEYDKAYRLTLDQHEELARKNKSIRDINADLEKKVDERSNEVIENQKRLLKYSFFHSHNLRGPLTNLLTIHEALSLSDLSVDEMTDLIKKLEEETKRLDEEVRNIQDSLQNNDFSEFYHLQSKQEGLN